jgi:flagellar motility protein MotE (MotC chaperone)
MGGVLKKVVIAFQVMVLVVFVAKVITMADGFRKFAGSYGTMASMSQAMAQTPIAPAAQPAPRDVQSPPRDVLSEPLTRERTLEEALQAKLQNLEQREELLKKEEQRLLALKLELTEKIDALRLLQQQITSATEAFKTEETKRIKDLARVYEAMPPAKAGAMLETLDTPTAAGITMNMKRDKAGTIWGYLSQKKAAEITKEITRTLKTAGDKKS